jgi:hypothetical protein
MFAQMVSGYWSDIGNPAQYFETLHDLYAGKVDCPIPEPVSRYFDNGVVFWPGAREKAQTLGAILSGNVLAALPFDGPQA